VSTRKPNGRSSIYQGKDGTWHGRVSMGVKDDGSPDRRHVEARAEAEVTRKVRALERKRDAGNVEKAGKPMTLAAWLTLWLDTVAPRTASRSTIDSTYRPKIRNWIIPRLGAHRLDRLQPEHLDSFYIWLQQEQGLAQNTVLQVHRILSRALKVAVMRGRVARNVASLVDAPSAEEIELKPLDAADARSILAATAGTRNGARWSVALALGLRQCEALGLRWEYVDLATGEMRVWWQIKRNRYRHGCDDPHVCGAGYHRAPHPPGCKHTGKCPTPCRPKCTGHARSCPARKGGGYEFREPKGKGKRTVSIPPQLLAALKAHRTAQLAERLAAGPAWENWDLVFCQANGKPIETHDDWEQWRDLLAEVGVRHVRVHDARHTAATLLLEQGVDVRVVQVVLGHSSLNMTRRYAHVTAKLTQDAAQRMGSLLWAGEN
jgi:integrase